MTRLTVFLAFAPGKVVVEDRTDYRNLLVLVINGASFVASVIALEQAAVDQDVRVFGLPETNSKGYVQRSSLGLLTGMWEGNERGGV